MTYLRLPNKLIQRQLDVALQALQKIADADREGNRTPDGKVAFQALQEIQALVPLRTPEMDYGHKVGGES